jgi:hypothetical protein
VSIARFALVARDDRQEVLLALVHYALEGAVDALSVAEHPHVVGELHRAHPLGGAGVLLHRAPQQHGFAADVAGELDQRLHPGDVAGEGGGDDAAVVVLHRLHRVLEVSTGDGLAGGATLLVGVGAVLDVAQHALAAQFCEPVHVDGVAQHRVVVHPLVQSVDDGALRRVQHGVDGLDDGVGHVDELQFQALADAHRLAGVHLHQVVADLELPLVVDLLADEFDGERRRDDGRVVAVCELRDGADVVEVTVGRHDGLDLAVEFAHDPVVRDGAHVDEVEAVHLLGADVVVNQYLRQVQAHVEDDDVVAGTDGGHLATDLLVPADGCDFDIHSGVRSERSQNP